MRLSIQNPSERESTLIGVVILTRVGKSDQLRFSRERHSTPTYPVVQAAIYVPRPNLEIYIKSLAYSGPKIWNTLPESIRNAPNLGLFKHLDLRSVRNQTLYVPRPNLEIYIKSLAYSGPKIWNTLPESIRNAPN